MTDRTKRTVWVSGAIVLFLLGTAWFLSLRFRDYAAAEFGADVRAAIAARNSPRRVERFLELRYGPLTEARNRQAAFLDFFNTPHIEALQLIVSRTPEEMKHDNNVAMAHWIANYRKTMTAEERIELGKFFSSDAGRAKLHGATAQYLSQGAQYRASTAPVIRELLATVAAVQQQHPSR